MLDGAQSEEDGKVHFSIILNFKIELLVLALMKVLAKLIILIFFDLDS